MDWATVESRPDANHNAVVVLNGDHGKDVQRLEVKAGAAVSLSSAGTSDPDGDALAYRWFVYHEAGGCGERIALDGAAGASSGFKAPEVESLCEIHVIREVTGNGTPPLYGYRRVVVTVKPR